jgi:hypothetical protein
MEWIVKRDSVGRMDEEEGQYQAILEKKVQLFDCCC